MRRLDRAVARWLFVAIGVVFGVAPWLAVPVAASDNFLDQLSASRPASPPLVVRSLSFNIETTKPTIVANLLDGAGGAIAPNGADWFNQRVHVHFTCSDPVFPIVSCGPDVTLGEGAKQKVTGTVVDSEENTNSTTVGPLNIELTPPTITAALGPAPNANGWDNQDLTVTFTCADGLSGILQCPNPVKVTSDSDAPVTGTVSDRAGNSATVTVAANLDKTPPSVVLGGVQDGASYPLSATPVIGIGDNLSGVDMSSISITLDGSPYVPGTTVLALGAHLVSVSASDLAGNPASVAAHFSISHLTSLTWTGDTSGVYSGIAHLAAVLVDSSVTPNQPVAGASLTLKAGSQSCTAVTDALGRASCTRSLGFSAGDYSWNVSFGPSSAYGASFLSGDFPVARAGTSLSLASPGEVTALGAVNVQARLVDSGGTPIAGRPVLITAGGAPVSVNTNSSGIANLAVSLAPGKYALAATFSEDADYTGSAAAGTLQVLAQPSPEPSPSPSPTEQPSPTPVTVATPPPTPPRGPNLPAGIPLAVAVFSLVAIAAGLSYFVVRRRALAA